MAILIDTGAQKKLQALFMRLEEEIPERALRPTAMAMAMDAAARAPSPEVEFNTMMYGGFDTGSFSTVSYIPGAMGAITDSDNRVRFYKPNFMYLRNFIPTSFTVNGLWAGVGFIPGLNEASNYTYVNVHSQSGYRPGSGMTYEHEVVYPFWEAWENGGIFTVGPRDFGNQYPHSLKPSDGVTNLFQMTKAIPARAMFSSVDRQAIVNDILIPNIRNIVKSR